MAALGFDPRTPCPTKQHAGALTHSARQTFTVVGIGESLYTRYNAYGANDFDGGAHACAPISVTFRGHVYTGIFNQL